MGYWLEDEDGWLGDFASNMGVKEMRDSSSVPAILKDFLDTGMADTEETKQIANDLEGVVELKYVKDMFSKARPPITLTDGSGSEEESLYDPTKRQGDSR